MASELNVIVFAITLFVSTFLRPLSLFMDRKFLDLVTTDLALALFRFVTVLCLQMIYTVPPINNNIFIYIFGLVLSSG